MTEPAPKLTPSRNTRIAGDLGDKLDELLVVLGLTAAEYLDPLKANGAAIRAMKAARARAAKLRDESPELVNDLGGES
jgi:hypothetical protein